jgi:thiol-disulfide isomerase/thioredoxin
MKPILFAIVFLITINSSFSQTNSFVKLDFEITNKENSYLNITAFGNQLIKVFNLNKEGVLKDSIHIINGFYSLNDNIRSINLFLKNGYDLKIKRDMKNNPDSIIFTGKGSLENTILNKRILANKKYIQHDLSNLNEKELLVLIDEMKNEDFERLKDKRLDSLFVRGEKSQINMNVFSLRKKYAKILITDQLKGTVSASFDYENHMGGKTKLEDFKGKYVYIDVWATWCGPCRGEIPALKKVEEKYHDKNIAFISISVDVDKDHEKWKNFVNDKQLGGVQLFADKDWNSDFIKSYGVISIPRFILIDPNGKIIKSDAARPSNPELQKVLDSLLN